MSDTPYLIFLLINVFLVGVLLAFAVQHALAHFRPHPEEKRTTEKPLTAQLPPAVRAKLLAESEDNFHSVLEKSATQLERDQEVISSHLNKQLEKLGTRIVDEEMERYRDSLEKLRQETEQRLLNSQASLTTQASDITTQLDTRREELLAKVEADVAAEKERLVAQIDAKLADAVASFLTETLQHNVDLGAQEKYLIEMLEQHKTELAKEVAA